MNEQPDSPGQNSADGQRHSASSVSEANRSDSSQAAQQTGGSQGQTAAADGSQANSISDQTDRVQFVQRVANAFQTAAARDGSVRIRLYPPELGSLRVELTVRNGTMSGRMETETETARSMLLEHMPALRERLAEHNIRVDRLDVELSGQSAGNMANQSGGHSSRYDPRSAQASASSARAGGQRRRSRGKRDGPAWFAFPVRRCCLGRRATRSHCEMDNPHS